MRGINNEDKKVAQAAVEPLIALLQDQDSSKRAAAALILGLIGDPRAVEPLTMALKQDESPEVRQEALFALGNLPEDKVIEPLISALSDADATVQKKAVEVLGYNPALEAVKPLLQMFRDDNGNLSYHIKDAMRYVNKVFPDGNVVDTLINALQDENPNVRAGAARALATIDDMRAAGPLRMALQDQDAIVRVNAARAMIEMRVPERKSLFASLTERFIADLQDNRAQVRELAASILEELGDERAVDSLLVVISDENARARRAAADTLGRMRERKAVEVLMNALKDESWRVREAAARALGRIGDVRAVDALAEALYDDQTWVRTNVVWALGSIKDERAVKALIRATRHPAPNVRGTAIYVLRKMDNEQALNAIRNGLDDPDQAVRHIARNVLRTVGFDPNVEANRLHTGRVLEEQVRDCVYTLKEALYQLEDSLAHFNYDGRLVHDWRFHVEEVLDSFRGALVEMTEIFSTPDLQQVPKLLYEFTNHVLYATHSENEYHLRELEKLLMKVLPEDEESDED